VASTATSKQLERWLRQAPLDELCLRADPFDPAWEGLLYAEQVTSGTYDRAADDAFAERHGLGVDFHGAWLHTRRLREEGVAQLVSGPWLSSEAPTPFVLDGRRFASVACFYEALKLREDDPEREAVAMGSARGRGRRRRPAVRGSFHYSGEGGGQEIAAGSPEHGALVARATAAKVEAHAEVRRALAATGRSRLYMGVRFHDGPQALGRYMPFCLMVLRHRATKRR